MLYGIVLLVICVVIIGLWLVRLAVLQSRKAKYRHADPETRATMIGPQVTFMGTARDVGDRFFGEEHQGADQRTPYQRMNAETYAQRQGEDRAVNREDAEAGDPELPSYNDTTTMPMPPPAAYASPITAHHESRNNVAAPSTTTGEAPPKYDAEPPIVRQL